VVETRGRCRVHGAGRRDLGGGVQYLGVEGYKVLEAVFRVGG
jgi:hypothetical protein